MHPKDADGMANSVDPDQTALRSRLIWVYSFHRPIYPNFLAGLGAIGGCPDKGIGVSITLQGLVVQD